MSGTLYITSLLLNGYKTYHDPAHGVFHCTYADEELAYFGLSWFDIDEKHTIKVFKKKYWNRSSYLKQERYIPVKEISWFYTYLKDREPDSPIEHGAGHYYREMVSSLTGIDTASQKRQDLLAWRDELCHFLTLALERNEQILSRL